MANHKSALKRIRQNKKANALNKYQHKSTRTAVKRLKGTTDQKEASELLKNVYTMIDRLVKKNIIHKNKAANQKSKLTKYVNGLG
jgi:small subunit ribosomal protein S20